MTVVQPEPSSSASATEFFQVINGNQAVPAAEEPEALQSAGKPDSHRLGDRRLHLFFKRLGVVFRVQSNGCTAVTGAGVTPSETEVSALRGFILRTTKGLRRLFRIRRAKGSKSGKRRFHWRHKKKEKKCTSETERPATAATACPPESADGAKFFDAPEGPVEAEPVRPNSTESSGATKDEEKKENDYDDVISLWRLVEMENHEVARGNAEKAEKYKAENEELKKKAEKLKKQIMEAIVDGHKTADLIDASWVEVMCSKNYEISNANKRCQAQKKSSKQALEKVQEELARTRKESKEELASAQKKAEEEIARIKKETEEEIARIREKAEEENTRVREKYSKANRELTEKCNELLSNRDGQIVTLNEDWDEAQTELAEVRKKLVKIDGKLGQTETKLTETKQKLAELEAENKKLVKEKKVAAVAVPVVAVAPVPVVPVAPVLPTPVSPVAPAAPVAKPAKPAQPALPTPPAPPATKSTPQTKVARKVRAKVAVMEKTNKELAQKIRDLEEAAKKMAVPVHVVTLVVKKVEAKIGSLERANKELREQKKEMAETASRLVAEKMELASKFEAELQVSQQLQCEVVAKEHALRDAQKAATQQHKYHDDPQLASTVTHLLKENEHLAKQNSHLAKQNSHLTKKVEICKAEAQNIEDNALAVFDKFREYVEVQERAHREAPPEKKEAKKWVSSQVEELPPEAEPSEDANERPLSKALVLYGGTSSGGGGGHSDKENEPPAEQKPAVCLPLREKKVVHKKGLREAQPESLNKAPCARADKVTRAAPAAAAHSQSQRPRSKRAGRSSTIQAPLASTTAGDNETTAPHNKGRCGGGVGRAGRVRECCGDTLRPFKLPRGSASSSTTIGTSQGDQPLASKAAKAMANGWKAAQKGFADLNKSMPDASMIRSWF